MMIMCLMCSLYIDELNCFSKRDCWTQIFINSVQMCIYLLLYYLKLCMHAVNTIWMNDKVKPRAMTKKKLLFCARLYSVQFGIVCWFFSARLVFIVHIGLNGWDRDKTSIQQSIIMSRVKKRKQNEQETHKQKIIINMTMMMMMIRF